MSDGLKLVSAALTAGAAGVITRLDPTQLIDNERTVFDFVKSHYRSYRDLPTIQTVQEETGIRIPIATDSLEYYIDQVQTRFEYNLIRDRFADLRAGLADRDMAAVSQTVASMSDALRQRRRGDTSSASVVNIQEGMRLVSDRLSEVRGTGGISGITTHWPKFNSITGGYQNADLISWVGRMGTGKTYIHLRQAMAAHEDGESVMFVTTEMGSEQIARRYAALALGINPTLLKNGTVSTYTERRIRDLHRGMVGSDRFKLFSVGMNSKVQAVESLMQEFSPTVVFIDGVYLLRPTDAARNANRTDKIAGVYDELKALTLDAGVPIVVTTQFNRQAGKGGKDGSLENIGYTDAIGTHSSIVVALKDGPTENPRDSRTFDFLKGREGESGTVAINFKFAPLNMDEMTEEEVTEEEGVSMNSVQWMGMRNSRSAQA